ncbi:hypothetical protein FCV25MIE_26130 [Fagus crenata]
MQGPLRDPTRGPKFGRSLRGVFRSTGSAEGGGGGDRSRLISVLRAEDQGWSKRRTLESPPMIPTSIFIPLGSWWLRWRRVAVELERRPDMVGGFC